VSSVPRNSFEIPGMGVSLLEVKWLFKPLLEQPGKELVKKEESLFEVTFECPKIQNGTFPNIIII
jgi:hypothetical protein